MKTLVPLLALACLAQAYAQTAYTAPSGYVKVDIPGAATGSTSLIAISATLMNEVEYSGSATISANFATNSQTISVTGTTWSTTQWTTEPHIAYITNGDATPAEEAYLITGSPTNTTLTVSTTFDLLSPGRFPSGTDATILTIRKAHTIGSLFGRTTSEVLLNQFPSPALADLIYVWTGSTWVTYYYTGSAWGRTGGTGAVDPADDVIFPDEGLFVLRKGNADSTGVTLTFFGDVPTKPQIATIPGNSLTFISTRYPIGTTIAQTGLETTPGWMAFPSPALADKVFSWTGSEWVTYYYNGSAWVLLPGSSGLAVTDPLPSNSALFVSRVSAGTEAESPSVSGLPYTVE